jgi:putative redox protein
MKINLSRINDNFTFEAKDAEGHEMIVDAGKNLGGDAKGFSPMQLLLIGIAGCSGIDMVLILKKQRQEIDSFEIEVEGLREKTEEFSVWKEITLHYKLKGKIDAEKAQRAAHLSHEKYCSVSKALAYSSTIHFKVSIE